MNKALGVAIIGLGVGEQHARAFASHSACQIRWLCDRDSAKAREVHARVQQGNIAESFEQCINDKAVDIIVIASYDGDHFIQVLSALECEKHVFVEKPLCQTLAQVKAIKSVWKKYNGRLKLGSNLVLRAAPIFQWLKKQISMGNMGEIYAFYGDYLYGRFNKLTLGWRGQDKHYSVMEGGGIHILDLMLWLIGEQPNKVASYGNRIASAQWQEASGKHLAFAGNDFVSSTFTYPNSSVATISANFACVHPHQHSIRIFGTEASFLLDDMGARFHLGRDNNPNVEQPGLPTLPKSKADLVPDFIDAVRQDQDHDTHTQDIFNAICLCVASEHAITERKETVINYI